MEEIMKNEYRTHSCGALREENVGEEVVLSGWVDTIRDHGGITFLDLRDRYGRTQIILSQEPSFRIGKEDVIRVHGKVRMREEENFNDKYPTGRIEVVSSKVDLLGDCRQTLPFDIEESQKVSEDVRLKYRYLDLRNPKMQEKLMKRCAVIQDIRTEMIGLGFCEITTPILTVSSPEGARDYLVPSRVHQGKFYALPQAPQQFKQLLMVAGMDKYFQIAPCFRDEDARADRSPGEFYQFDMEMSFATQEDVFKVMEHVLPKIFEKYGKYKVDQVPFKRLSYKDAMEKYGSDKPDLRNPLVITNITKVFENTTFMAFKDKTVRAICAPKAALLSRRTFDEITNTAIEFGAKGLAWVKLDSEGKLVGPIVKFMSEEEQQALIKATGIQGEDALFIVADTDKMCSRVLGKLRTMLCDKLDLLEKDIYKFCWITDFPMYEENEETGMIDFCHNPFSMPQGGLEALKTQSPLDILAYQYDITVNGIELSSGAVRNHDLDIMLKAFEIAGYNEETIKAKFGAFYNAFKFGAPPHAGIAPGVDRMLMLLEDEDSIREIIAFPMNKKAQDLMMGAPGDVTEQQLREVHIKLR